MKDKIKQIILIYESGKKKGYNRNAFIAKSQFLLKEELNQRGIITHR